MAWRPRSGCWARRPAPVTARATVDGFNGSPVTFTHTAVPANPTALVLVSGDDQTAPGGFEVAEDLVVRLEDDNGNGIGGRQITWVVPPVPAR